MRRLPQAALALLVADLKLQVCKRLDLPYRTIICASDPLAFWARMFSKARSGRLNTGQLH